MFFLNSNPISILVAVIAVAIVWFLEIWVDNNFARVKWQAMLSSAWIVALVFGGINIILMMF